MVEVGLRVAHPLAIGLGLAVFLGISSPAPALSLNLGLAAFQAGDDQIRPAMVAHADWTDNLFTTLNYYGRDYGLVRQRTVIGSFGYRGNNYFGSKRIYAGFGLAGIEESTTLYGGQPTEKSERARNVGATVGLSYRVIELGGLVADLSWDSYIFPAGLGGFIFLAHGDESFVSLTAGWTL